MAVEANPANALQQAPGVILPRREHIRNVLVTSAAVIHVDLATISSGVAAAVVGSVIWSMIASADVYVAVSDGATDAIDGAAVSGSTNQCAAVPANQMLEGFPPGQYLHLLAVTDDAYVRIWPSSRRA